VPGSIRFEAVSFAYPEAEGARRQALTGIDLVLERGRILAVAGANGSGKSTLAQLCDGLLLPSSGRVTVDGLDTIAPGSLWSIRERVGMVFQDPDDQIVGAFVEEDVAFGPENLGAESAEIRRRVDAALQAVGLSGLERREPHLLSEGQKQRLAIAGAIAMEPAYLVMDEPAAFLDPAGRAEVLGLVARLARERGHGVLHVSHDLAGVVGADEVIVLDEGRIAFRGRPGELLTDAALLDRAGLSLTPLGRLAEGLRERGVPVPADAMSPELVAGALCR
jgi:energy-coupling factor transport system ATP-binding protein